MSQAAAARLLEAQFNHLALPGRVPSKRDDKIIHIETALINRLLDASRYLRDGSKDDLYFEWDHIRRILLTTKALNIDGKLDKRALCHELCRLEQGSLLILHVTEQNAGLLIRRPPGSLGNEVTFEVFEASPCSEDVLAAESALQWDFPGNAVAVPYFTFAGESFQDNLASFLEQCSTESIKRFSARAAKARSYTIETRDTVDPAMIAQLLTC